MYSVTQQNLEHNHNDTQSREPVDLEEMVMALESF
jgi:hypothetical protein